MRRILLACGVVSSVLYVVADVIASRRYRGYSYSGQMVSELYATGAPTQRFIRRSFVPDGLLLMAFSLGIWSSGGGDRRASRRTAVTLFASAVSGMVTLLFFPMDRRGDAGTLRGRMHPPMTLVGSVFILLAQWFGSTLHGAKFRAYSIVTIVTLLVFGGWTGLDGPKIARGEPTPRGGLKERVNIYAYLLWVAVLAMSLMRAPAATRAGS